KTTSFRMAVGMITPDSGSVMFRGQEVTREPMYRRARLGMGYLSQEPSIFRQLTVQQNIQAVLETMKMRSAERKQRVDSLIDEMDLGKVRESIAETLSGGERRRLEIARALSTDPRLILLDEPFSGVDPIAVSNLQEIIQQLSRRGIGILITDHNVRETLSTTDRAYIIDEGRILSRGTPEEIIRDPKARKFYLGEKFRMDLEERDAPPQAEASHDGGE
ncbi:MAG: LPS export ABC transporter ATP-binding protein, partial [Planctomycetota bacterium]|nr:LPS export ABC transporter ATP-binding protein [Planctomycetota bacterium]